MFGPIPNTLGAGAYNGTFHAHNLVTFSRSASASGAIGGKLADPYTGPARFREPFDIGYYRWKYGKPAVRKANPEPEQQPEKYRPSDFTEQVELEALRLRNAETDREIKALSLYVDEIEQGIEQGLSDRLSAEEAQTREHVAMIAVLEQNLADAREVLLLAMALQLKQRNELAVITATLYYFY